MERNRQAPAKALSEDACLAILGIAGDNGLLFGAGHCGSTAIAINQVLFGGAGIYQAVVNTYLWSKGRFTGHIGVFHEGLLWDASGYYFGEAIEEGFCSWAMLDPLDPDYHFETDQQAYDYTYLPLSLAQVERHLPTVYQPTALEILKAARAVYEGRSTKSLQYA